MLVQAGFRDTGAYCLLPPHPHSELITGRPLRVRSFIFGERDKLILQCSNSYLPPLVPMFSVALDVGVKCLGAVPRSFQHEGSP